MGFLIIIFMMFWFLNTLITLAKCMCLLDVLLMVLETVLFLMMFLDFWLKLALVKRIIERLLSTE
jgi:hypothetical protein